MPDHPVTSLRKSLKARFRGASDNRLFGGGTPLYDSVIQCYLCALQSEAGHQYSSIVDPDIYVRGPWSPDYGYTGFTKLNCLAYVPKDQFNATIGLRNGSMAELNQEWQKLATEAATRETLFKKEGGTLPMTEDEFCSQLEASLGGLSRCAGRRDGTNEPFRFKVIKCDEFFEKEQTAPRPWTLMSKDYAYHG